MKMLSNWCVLSLCFWCVFCVAETTETCGNDVSLPKVRIGGRSIDILNGKHFDEILEETPDGMRPPSLVMFYDYSDQGCMDRVNHFDFDAFVRQVGDRSSLLVGRYDSYSNVKRTWYEFTPEMNLTKRLGVSKCPEFVFVPPHCRGDLEWCIGNDRVDGLSYEVGCDDFVDHCGANVVHRFDQDLTHENLLEWLEALRGIFPKPSLNPQFKSFDEQSSWLRKRDITTTDNQLRNLYFPLVIPNFTEHGFKVIKTPERFQSWLLDFYERHQKDERIEQWQADATQLNFHEMPTVMYNLDMEFEDKVRFGDETIKPILEQWSGIPQLSQTSFYGIRGYPNKMNLKEHIDRIDTHVISATISLKKLSPNLNAKRPWPIQVVAWDGKHVRYNHDEGMTVLYESARQPHGRPFPNKGGIHLGCFIHFKPTDDSVWKNYVNKARQLKNENMEWET